MIRLVVLFLFFTLAHITLAADVPSANLDVGNKTLFVFKHRVGSIDPQERVKIISDRIKRVAEDYTFDPKQIIAQEEPDIGWSIYAGDQILMVVTAMDAQSMGTTPKVIAEHLALRLREIISQDRERKTPKNIIIASIYALLSTLVLLFLLLGVKFIYARMLVRIEKMQGSTIQSLRIKTFEVLPAERITVFMIAILKTLRLLVILALLYVFVPLVFSFFPWTENLTPILLGYLYNPLHHMVKAFIAFIPNLFFIVFNVFVTIYILKFIRIFFSEIEKGTLHFSGFYAEWAEPTFQLVRVLVIAFSAIIIFPYIPGSSSPAFQGVSVFLGVLLSLGSTSAIANIISGLVLTYMRSFKVGDRVKISDTFGDVIEKSLLVTKVKTTKNVDITIPNSLVLGSHIINYSSLAPTEGLILHTEVTIGYDVPWRKVHNLLIEAALAVEDIQRSPMPFVLQTSLNDSFVSYQINAYTKRPNSMATIYSNLHQSIQDSFNAAKVEIMSPHYSAIRDGNTTTIPPKDRASDYKAPSFRVNSVPLDP